MYPRVGGLPTLQETSEGDSSPGLDNLGWDALSLIQELRNVG